MAMVTVITGSASGIGAAVRKRLEKSGDKVIGVDLRNAEIIADLATKDGRNFAIAEIKKICGDHIDRLVADAGVEGLLHQDLSRIIAVNYFGVVDLIDGLFDLLRRGENPAAVVISSNAAQQAPMGRYPLVLALLNHDEDEANRIIQGLSDPVTIGSNSGPRAGVVYMVSKNAVGRATRRRATLWGNAGVRINSVAPGFTKTPMLQRSLDDPQSGPIMRATPVPLGRFAEPEELAAVITFLLSTEASYIHGAVIYVDGGVDPMIRPDRF
jgi:NAD(P)-dependent dehydrogenase (short-subunit alcohol dehydrogenase family)